MHLATRTTWSKAAPWYFHTFFPPKASKALIKIIISVLDFPDLLSKWSLWKWTQLCCQFFKDRVAISKQFRAYSRNSIVCCILVLSKHFVTLYLQFPHISQRINRCFFRYMNDDTKAVWILYCTLTFINYSTLIFPLIFDEKICYHKYLNGAVFSNKTRQVSILKVSEKVHQSCTAIG